MLRLILNEFAVEELHGTAKESPVKVHSSAEIKTARPSTTTTKQADLETASRAIGVSHAGQSRFRPAVYQSVGRRSNNLPGRGRPGRIVRARRPRSSYGANLAPDEYIRGIRRPAPHARRDGHPTQTLAHQGGGL